MRYMKDTIDDSTRKQRNISQLLYDAKHDKFSIVLDTNILLNYCGRDLKRVVPRYNSRGMNPDYISAINAIHKIKKIKLSRVIHNEFHGVLYYWICDQNYNLYKDIISQLATKYAGTILENIKLHDGDTVISKDSLKKVDQLRIQLKRVNPSKYLNHIIRKQTSIEARGGRVRASVWKIPTHQERSLQDKNTEFDRYEMYTENDKEILAYCISQPRCVLYTNDSDFVRFKQEIEDTFKHVRVFSDLDEFRYSSF